MNESLFRIEPIVDYERGCTWWALFFGQYLIDGTFASQEAAEAAQTNIEALLDQGMFDLIDAIADYDNNRYALQQHNGA